MLDILVGEALTSRALRQADAFSESLVIGFAVCRVEVLYWKAASNVMLAHSYALWVYSIMILYTYRHCLETKNADV